MPDDSKYSWVTRLKPLTQMILAIGFCIIAGGIAYSLGKYGNVSFNKQMQKIESDINNTKAYIKKDQMQSDEIREAILADPKLKQAAPKFYETVKKHTIEDEKKFVRSNPAHTPYFMDVDNLMSAGYIEIKDEASKYIKLPYIEDVFIVYPDNAFPKPEDKLEVTFAEDDINIKFKKKIFEKEEVYRPLMRYIPPIEKANQELWQHYKHIKADLGKQKQQEEAENVDRE